MYLKQKHVNAFCTNLDLGIDGKWAARFPVPMISNSSKKDSIPRRAIEQSLKRLCSIRFQTKVSSFMSSMKDLIFSKWELPGFSQLQAQTSGLPQQKLQREIHGPKS